MKIIIENHIIETDFIYHITPVVFDKKNEEVKFTINFLNEKSLKIGKYSLNDFKKKIWNDDGTCNFEYYNYYNKNKESIINEYMINFNKLREELLDFLNNNPNSYKL
jgi:hypothetical protein